MKDRSRGDSAAGGVEEHDALFARPQPRLADFRFDEKTAAVFDDMVSRSVPYYREIERMSAELAADFAVDGTAIYDLGCSTGTTLLEIWRLLTPNRRVRMVGMDASQAMIDKARAKFGQEGLAVEPPGEKAAGDPAGPIARLVLGDLTAPFSLENASVALMLFTLQFIRPIQREGLLRRIHQGLCDGGCFIMAEKTVGDHPVLNRLFIEHYHAMKRRNGYSDLEISQKREALENVLVPYRVEENRELLRAAGFQHTDVFFKWYNFCAIVAVK